MHPIENAAHSLIGLHRIEQLHAIRILDGRETTFDQHMLARLRYLHQKRTESRPVRCIRPDALERDRLAAQTLQHLDFSTIVKLADHTLTGLVHIANGDGRKWNVTDARRDRIQRNDHRRCAPLVVDVTDKVGRQTDDGHEGDGEKGALEKCDLSFAHIVEAVQR